MQDIKKQAIASQYASTNGLSARIRFHERYNTNPENWWPWAFRQIREATGDGSKEILEVGCGRGDLWKRAEDARPNAWRIHLTDASEQMVEATASKNIQGVVSIEKQEATEAIANAGDLDAVIANHMLYCLTDQERALFLQGVANRLKQRQGVLCASTNGLGQVAELWNLVFEFDSTLRPLVEETREVYSSVAFCKENGRAQLAPFFSQVEWRDYGCAYQVDDADLFCGFVNSFLPIEAALTERGQQQALKEFVTQQINKDGHVIVHTVSGMFLARP